MNKTDIRKFKKESLVTMVFENQGLKGIIKTLQNENKELVIQNSQLNNELKINKDMSVTLSEYQNIKTKNKHLENLLKEYKDQIDATKINYIKSLEAKNIKLENQNKTLINDRRKTKDEYKPKHLLKLFEDTKNENEKLKEEIETLKVKYKEITIKQEKQTQLITELYNGL